MFSTITVFVARGQSVGCRPNVSDSSNEPYQLVPHDTWPLVHCAVPIHERNSERVAM